MFEVSLVFSGRILESRPTSSASQILQLLRIEGPWSETERLGDPETVEVDWSIVPVTYGLARLCNEATIGVKIIPDTNTGRELLIAFPPRQLRRHFGPFPWRLDTGWVTQPVVDLHRDLIGKSRMLHSASGLKAALLQDEAWTFSLPKDAEGIFVHPDVAEAADLKGERRGDFLVIPF